MQPTYYSDLRFTCPLCHAVSTVPLIVADPYPSHENDGDYVDISGSEYITCPNCRKEFEVDVHINGASCSASFMDHDKYIIETSDVYLEDDGVDFFDYVPPEDPLAVLLQEGKGAMELLRFGVLELQSSTLHRMVFVHLISSMEAYLQDKIKISVKNSMIARHNIIKNNEKLNEEKYSIREIYNSDFLNKKISIYLAGILYHNIPVVEHVIQSLSNGVFAPPEKEKIELLKSVSKRHDCAHRGGFDKKGARIALDEKYIQETWECIKKYCLYVDDYINEVTEEIIPF